MFNVPINEKPFYNTDSIANSISSNDMFDCYLEPVPGINFVNRRRPGLVLHTDLGTGQKGDGIFWWDAMNRCIAVSSGKIFEVFSDGTNTPFTGTMPISGIPVKFADGQALDGTPWLYLASGVLNYITSGLISYTPTDTNTPEATHVAWLNSRFLANNVNTNQFLFTDTNPTTGNIENDYWSSTDNPLTCEAKGDKLEALFVAWQEIYNWGSEGLEIWQDDGTTPFSPLQGAFAEAGIEAVYSFARADNTIFALCVIDGKRCVVKLQGRTPAIVSEPVARILADMADVSDAIGDIISVGGLAIYLLSFPSVGQTWAYDYKNDTWSRWGYWNVITGDYDRFLGQHSCFCKAWNKHLIMSRADGKIYELRRDIFTDDGNIIRSMRRTGWIDRTSWKRKRVDQFYLKAKVKEAIAGETYTLLLRWRDNGNPVFSTYMELPLNPDYQGDCLIKLNRFGMYRSRQYEFVLTDDIDMVLVGATEQYTELRN